MFELPCASVESWARIYVKTIIWLFPYYTETTRSTYQVLVPVPGIYSQRQFAAGAPIVLRYEKGYAVRIEPRPPSINTCRLCASSSRTLFWPQASGDGTRMQGALGESRASCRLSFKRRAGSNSGSQQQQHVGLVANCWRWLTHPPHRPPPMPYREFLAEGRASVGLYATAPCWACDETAQLWVA